MTLSLLLRRLDRSLDHAITVVACRRLPRRKEQR